MKVYLDDEPMELDAPSLRTAFGSAVELANGRGRVIVDVLIDGTPIPGDLIADPSDEPMAGEELRFTSAEPRAMVRETLLDAVEALDQVIEHQREAADLVMAGKIDSVRASLEPVVGIWQAVVLAIQRGAELLDLELDALRVEGEPLSVRIAGLSERLGEVIRAVDRSDWSALADTLAYDMGDQAIAWQTMLQELAQSIYPANSDGPANPDAGTKGP